MTRFVGKFWLRLAVSALFVTFPLAWAVAQGAIGLAPAFAYSGLAGAGMLFIWDGTRRPSEDEPAPVVLHQTSSTAGSRRRAPARCG